uniref:Putative salivary secreted kazaltype proteinase inhibitor n=1 Tax=Panstrongylus lignarius TaxID=156445 RepID=A0A224Y3U9_9HEMI
MKLRTSVFSVIVVVVFLCVLDKHVFGEVGCHDSCSLVYEPVCGDNGQEHVRFNSLCELERANSCNNRGRLFTDFEVISDPQCRPRQTYTPPT